MGTMTEMVRYMQVHEYPVLLGTAYVHVPVIGEPGRVPKGQPFDYRRWWGQFPYWSGQPLEAYCE